MCSRFVAWQVDAEKRRHGPQRLWRRGFRSAGDDRSSQIFEFGDGGGEVEVVVDGVAGSCRPGTWVRAAGGLRCGLEEVEEAFALEDVAVSPVEAGGGA